MTPSNKDTSQNDSWTEWSKFVLKELERNNDSIESLRKENQSLRVDLVTIQTKVYLITAGIGIIAGAIGTAIAKMLVGGG